MPSGGQFSCAVDSDPFTAMRNLGVHYRGPGPPMPETRRRFRLPSATQYPPRQRRLVLGQRPSEHSAGSILTHGPGRLVTTMRRRSPRFGSPSQAIASPAVVKAGGTRPGVPVRQMR